MCQQPARARAQRALVVQSRVDRVARQPYRVSSSWRDSATFGSGSADFGSNSANFGAISTEVGNLPRIRPNSAEVTLNLVEPRSVGRTRPNSIEVASNSGSNPGQV